MCVCVCVCVWWWVVEWSGMEWMRAVQSSENKNPTRGVVGNKDNDFRELFCDR